MLVDSEDMSKVRFICLRRSMPKLHLYLMERIAIL